ncbi:MAG: MazG-like family protein [Defluviitaleaceae bacterium]|nr:MazG-like family protein [Defluviitaleaceae bacterium]
MQQMVSDFVTKYNLHTSAEARYIDLVSEIGELGKEIIKGSDYGKTPFAQTPQMQDEIGDCLFSLLALCDLLEINAEEAVKKSLSKYETRFAEKGDIGCG